MARQRNDEQRKAQIREAAIRCFVRSGYASTRLLDIAKEAGMSKGGVYFYYRAKEQLFRDILRVQVQTLQERWSLAPSVDQPADRTLEHLVRTHLRAAEDDPNETRLGLLLASIAPRNEEFRRGLQDSFGVLRNLYAGVLARGMEDGVFERGNPGDLAAMILGMVQGVANQSVLHPTGKLPVGADEVARRVVHMVRARTRTRSGAWRAVSLEGPPS